MHFYLLFQIIQKKNIQLIMNFMHFSYNHQHQQCIFLDLEEEEVMIFVFVINKINIFLFVVKIIQILIMLPASDLKRNEKSRKRMDKGKHISWIKFCIQFMTWCLKAICKHFLQNFLILQKVKKCPRSFARAFYIKHSYFTSQLSIAKSSKMFISSFLERFVSQESSSRRLTVSSFTLMENVL